MVLGVYEKTSEQISCGAFVDQIRILHAAQFGILTVLLITNIKPTEISTTEIDNSHLQVQKQWRPFC
jgi:hypothetical protein